MKEQSNSFFVRMKNKIKMFFKGERNMHTTGARDIIATSNDSNLSLSFFSKLFSFLLEKKDDLKEVIQEKSEQCKRTEFLSLYKLNVKDVLKNETPTAYEIRRDRQYDKLKWNLSNVEAMRQANEKAIYYNKNRKANKEVNRIRQDGIEKKIMEQKMHGDR